MKKVFVAVLAMAMLLAVPAFSFAAETIGVVLNGSSEVNRETFMYFKKAIGQTGYSYDFTALTPSAALSGKYAGIIVLNTGRSSGTDPVLADFIAKNKDEATLVQVNLYQNQSAVTVTVVPAKNNDLGVDAVTSASLWAKAGMGTPGQRPSAKPAAGQGLNPLELEHLPWFKAALKLIADQKA